MIDSITSDKKIITWMLFHVGLGLVSAFTKFPLIMWFYIVTISSIYIILKTRDRTHAALKYLSYIFGMELLFRMSHSSPFIPYEAGKYVPFAIFVLAIIISKYKSPSYLGLIIILLMVPSSLVFIGEDYFDSFVFTFMGMITLGLSVQYFNKRIINKETFRKLIRAVVFPIVSILIFITIETPSFESVDFELGANFSTTGGFGSNQVSTLLGICFFLLSICYFSGITVFKYKLIDIGIIGYAFIRALLTFSRGGVIISVIGIIIFLGLSLSNGIRLYNFKLKNIIIFVVLLVAVAAVANRITSNSLLLRYQGETQTTLSGEKEKDLDVITTGRLQLFVQEVQIWLDNPILGVGPGGAQRERGGEKGNIASHSEYSRLLAENGIFGLAIILILSIFPFVRYTRGKKHNGKVIALAISMVALGMTFHAATRTFATPFLYGLSSASIYLVQNREQRSNQ